MAIGYLHEYPGGTQEHAEQLSDTLHQQGDMRPAGALFLSEGPMDGGWWAFSAWESERSARNFYDGRLGPIVSELGMTVTVTRRHDVYRHSNQPPGQ